MASSSSSSDLLYGIGCYDINKLTDTNYHIWRIRVKALLMLKDLWDVTKGEKEEGGPIDRQAKAKTRPESTIGGGGGTPAEHDTAEHDTAERDKAGKALLLITLLVSDSELDYIADCECPRDAWRKLREVNEERTRYSERALKWELASKTLLPGQDLRRHINTMMDLNCRLSVIGANMENEAFAMQLLCSVGSVYSINIMDGKITTSGVICKLLQQAEFQRFLSSGSTPGGSLAPQATKRKRRFSKRNVVCYNCQRKGHYARDCSVETRVEL